MGRKRWLLLPPSQQLLSAKPIQDWMRDADPNKDYPDGLRSCWQHAGDIMYVPDSWSHAVINAPQSNTEQGGGDEALSVSLAAEFYPV